MWQAEVGNIVEVLDFDGCKSTFKGDICIIAGGDKSGLQPHLVSLTNGDTYFPTGSARVRLLEAELIVKAYEGGNKQ